MDIENGRGRADETKLTRKLFVGFPFGIHQTNVFVPEGPTPEPRASSWEVGREKAVHDAQTEQTPVDQQEQVEPATEIVLLNLEDRTEG